MGERVRDRQAGDLGFVADGDRSQSGLVEGATEVRDLGSAVPERRVSFPPTGWDEVDLDVRVDGRELADRFGHVQSGREGDAEPFDASIHVMHSSDCRVDGRDDAARLFVQLLARGGQLHLAGRAFEQRAPKFLLERADLPAEDGLRDVQLLCRAAEVPVVGDGDEVAELPQVQIHALRVSIFGKGYWTLALTWSNTGSMLVITTPTGDIGRQLLRILLDTDEKIRVIVRDPAKLPDSVRDHVDVVAGSHGDAEVVNRAFAGADAVFWLVPPDSQAPSIDAAYTGFTRAAAQAFTGVGHVVGVSAIGRGTPVADRAGLVTASLAMDDFIASTGVAYRALAMPSFMDNLLRDVDSIRSGVYTGTVAADRKAPLVATADIAAAAARLLLDRSWTGAGEVRVLGPEDLSANDMARIMSDVLGRPVRYERQSLEAFGAELAGYGLGAPFVQGMVDMMRAKDEGLDAGVPRTPETTSPTTFRQWCERVLRPAVFS